MKTRKHRFSRQFRAAIFVSAIVAAVFATAFPRSAAAQDNSFVADTGFRPETDGFSFRNYNNDAGYSNLTAADVRRLFGDSACVRIDGNDCVLTPAGQEWMEDTNEKMGGGHCDGFAALSALLYLKQQEKGASQTSTLTIDGNEKLQREIALWWSTQILSPTLDSKMANFAALTKPSDVVKKFIDDTNNKTETYTLYIAQPDWSRAHVVTPYAIQDKGNGIYWLMAYDNNYPMQARHVEIDTNVETWKYSTAANPSDEASDYSGGTDPITMTLVPNSPRLQPQVCPFCQMGTTSSATFGFAKTAATYNEIWLNDSESATSNVHLLITDSQGNKLGYENGKLVNQIPGAQFVVIGSANLWESDIEPLYRIPVGIQFSVTIDGSQLKQTELSSVAMIGPGYDLAADKIKLDPGESDVMTFSPDGKMITYKPSSNESPDFNVGVQNGSASYSFEFKGFEVDKGATVSLELDYEKGRLQLHTSGNTNPSIYALQLTRYTSSESHTYGHDGLQLDPGATAFLDFGTWDGKGALSIEIDTQSDGKVDQTLTEENQK